MPRLTHADYLVRRTELIDLFNQSPGRFAVLSPRLQWAVHRYYQTKSRAEDASLLASQARIKLAEPSLPHVASKAYRRLVAPRPKVTMPSPVFRRDGVTVRGIVQPEIDAKKLAQAFMALAAYTTTRSGGDAGTLELEEDSSLGALERNR